MVHEWPKNGKETGPKAPDLGDLSLVMCYKSTGNKDWMGLTKSASESAGIVIRGDAKLSRAGAVEGFQTRLGWLLARMIERTR